MVRVLHLSLVAAPFASNTPLLSGSLTVNVSFGTSFVQKVTISSLHSGKWPGFAMIEMSNVRYSSYPSRVLCMYCLHARVTLRKISFESECVFAKLVIYSAGNKPRGYLRT